jgi:hypothetical protein
MRTIVPMDISRLIVFAHGSSGNLPQMDDMMFLFPAVPMLLIGTILIATALRNRGLLGADTRTVSVTATGAAIAATLSTGAAAIHFAVVPEHMAEFAPFGLAFVALAWFQVTWAQLYLLRPNRRIAAIGAVVSVAIAAIWVLSRTAGLPFGPQPWTPEPIGALDLLATALEITLVGILLPIILPRRWPAFAGQRIAFERAFVLATFCLLTVTLLTTFALLGEPAVEMAVQP